MRARPIGCTQSTEIISTDGVTLSGSLPPGCELATMYTAGITTRAAHAPEAQVLIGLLTGTGQRGQRERAGFDQIGPDSGRDSGIDSMHGVCAEPDLVIQADDRAGKAVVETRLLRCSNSISASRAKGRDFRLSKPIHILIYQSNLKATMPARAKKRTETPVRRAAAGNRRSGRPRAATAASRIYSDLRIELVSLQRRPGEVISEAEIALSYGVSRTPVREAILKLSDEGLLEIYPQSGIFVSRIPIAALPEAILIRKALEETTARLAAERATSSQI